MKTGVSFHQFHVKTPLAHHLFNHHQSQYTNSETLPHNEYLELFLANPLICVRSSVTLAAHVLRISYLGTVQTASCLYLFADPVSRREESVPQPVSQVHPHVGGDFSHP